MGGAYGINSERQFTIIRAELSNEQRNRHTPAFLELFKERADDKQTDSDEILERQKLRYAMKKLSLSYEKNTIEEANEKVKKKVSTLRDMLYNGEIKSKGTKAAVKALAEFVDEHLNGKEWKAVVLSLKEPNSGLRIAPDLARMLILDKNPEKAVEDYKQKVKEISAVAKFSFKATVISCYYKDSPLKMGPDYLVPILESDIDFETGKANGWYIIYMLRYGCDTCFVRGMGSDYFNRILEKVGVVSPHPEFEPIGFKVNREKEVTAIIFRPHWVAVEVPGGVVAKTKRGKFKITAPKDGDVLGGSAAWGHSNYPVIESMNPTEVYDIIRKENSSLQKAGGAQVALLSGLIGARENYNEGQEYDMRKIKKELVLQLAYNTKCDPLREPVIPTTKSVLEEMKPTTTKSLLEETRPLIRI
jgi:hypothetical protein